MKFLFILLLGFSGFSQRYNYETSFNRTEKGIVKSLEKGSVKITHDSIIIISDKRKVKIHVMYSRKFLTTKDSLYICYDRVYPALYLKDSINKRYELTISKDGHFDKYCLTKNDD